jgi:hypothetical protein
MQIGKNIEVYVDDVVVKTTEEDQLMADLTETFANLREFQWKLNPTKCVFGVPSGLLQGFMVGHRGIEANLAKVDAIPNMAKPSNKKDVMKLTAMMAALCHFISKLGEKGLLLTDKRRIPLRSASVWTPHLFHHGIPKVLVNLRSKVITSVRSTTTH